MGNSTFHDENVNIWPKTSQNLSTGCTLNFLRKVLKLKSEKTKLNLSVCHHRLWPVLGQTFTFQGKKSNLPYFPISSAQCSRCQLGCSGTQNFPCISGNCYRSILSEIRVSKSQAMESAAMDNGPAVNWDAPVVKIFHVFQVIARGAYYPKLEFENHKNQYFSWLLRSKHVKTNIFGNCMTKLTIYWSELARF